MFKASVFLIFWVKCFHGLGQVFGQLFLVLEQVFLSFRTSVFSYG